MSLLNIQPPAHRNAPRGTSEVAAARIAGHAPSIRERILAFIRDAGPEGVTDDEGESALDVIAQTYTPRRGELVKLKLIVDSGLRRNTRTGRPAAAWVAVEFAVKDSERGAL